MSDPETACVLAALPPVGAFPAKVDWIARDAGLDVDTALHRLALLCAAGEATARVEHGSLVACRAVPRARAGVAERGRSRFAPEPWRPTPEPGRGDP